MWTEWTRLTTSSDLGRAKNQNQNVSSISCWLLHLHGIKTQVSDSQQPPLTAFLEVTGQTLTLQLQDTPPQQQNMLSCNPLIDPPRRLFSGALCDMVSLSSTDAIKGVSKTVTPYFHFRIRREAKRTASVLTPPY